MNNIKERLSALSGNAKEFWERLNKRQRIMMGAVPLLLLVSIIASVAYLAYVGGRPNYQPLFTGLEVEDAAAIVDQLKVSKTRYELAENGTAILVPAKEVSASRLILAQNGLPASSNVGYELFDVTKLGVTDFTQKVNLRRAIEGELTRTIMSLEAVESARVMVVQPEDSLFTVEQKEPSASVALRLVKGQRITEEQVRGIMHLVASSVEDLKPANITVIDSTGEILSDFDEQNKESDKLKITELQLKYKKKIEDIHEKKILKALSKVFGENNVVVAVSAELDFDVHTKEDEIYYPVVGDSGITRSEQLIQEKYLGTGTVPEIGVPGTTSNIPGYKGLAEGNAQYDRSEETRNYEISRTLDKREKNQGDIRSISVAVMINDDISYEEENGEPVSYISRRRVAEIQDNVIAMANLVTERGDKVSVLGIKFTPESDTLAKEYQRQVFWQNVKRWTNVGILIFALIAMFVLTLMALRNSVVKEEIPEEVELYDDLEEPVSVEEMLIPELTDEQRNRERIREEVLRMIHDDPEGASLIVRSWLFDEPDEQK